MIITKIALVVGVFMVGYMIPDLTLALGGSDRNFGSDTNIVSAIGFGLIALHIAFG